MANWFYGNHNFYVGVMYLRSVGFERLPFTFITVRWNVTRDCCKYIADIIYRSWRLLWACLLQLLMVIVLFLLFSVASVIGSVDGTSVDLCFTSGRFFVRACMLLLSVS